MTYWMWLLGISAVFLAAERLWPRRPSQLMLRRGILDDLAYVVFNGHFLGLILAWLSGPLEHFLSVTSAHGGINLHPHLAKTWSLPVQFAVAFFIIDFAQWMIHNLMHRLPWLWEFHKVHHSIEELDWLGSMRFHWVEVVVYKSLQYPFLALLGFDYHVLFIIAVVSTFMGHFNHSNLRLNLGVAKFLFNGPQMHEWHHAHPDAGPANKNFAINLALWDWIFGTAYLPVAELPPANLGFSEMERFPRSMILQELWPVSVFLQRRRRAPPT
jgi:sterol desaturase/sphingolipid hydroxylase (fatty acid hydroxylase superfamily)